MTTSYFKGLGGAIKGALLAMVIWITLILISGENLFALAFFLPLMVFAHYKKNNGPRKFLYAFLLTLLISYLALVITDALSFSMRVDLSYYETFTLSNFFRALENGLYFVSDSFSAGNQKILLKPYFSPFIGGLVLTFFSIFHYRNQANDADHPTSQDQLDQMAQDAKAKAAAREKASARAMHNQKSTDRVGRKAKLPSPSAARTPATSVATTPSFDPAMPGEIQPEPNAIKRMLTFFEKMENEGNPVMAGMHRQIQTPTPLTSYPTHSSGADNLNRQMLQRRERYTNSSDHKPALSQAERSQTPQAIRQEPEYKGSELSDLNFSLKTLMGPEAAPPPVTPEPAQAAEMPLFQNW